ncbi:MAG: cyanophycinase [Ignavibacteriaceae bacterium]|nr:cyanophycinase [Ignavibacteriaceae bacterium]
MEKIIASIILILFSFNTNAQPKGTLFIIGGGNRSDELMKNLVELAGGTEGKVIVVPNASGDKIETADYLVKEINKLGFNDTEFLLFDIETADADSNLLKVEDAQIVYFSGGDQSRLTADLLGTKLFEKIKQVYSKGGIISGTSAGAAVMSHIMITGDELIQTDSLNSYNTIQRKNIKTTSGFGFIDGAVIDQHFIKRKRNNRLISVILENPQQLGIGIDESTAIIVYPDDTFKVIGDNQVIVYDAKDAVVKAKADSNLLAASGIKMNILFDGDKFDIKNRTVIK